MIAKVYYAKVTHPSEVRTAWFAGLYNEAHHGQETFVVLSHKDFRKYWVMMDITNAGKDDLEQLFAKYNDDDKNPLGTTKGQERVRKSGTHHTSMSVLDIIQLGKDYWMVAGSGFKKVRMK